MIKFFLWGLLIIFFSRNSFCQEKKFVIQIDTIDFINTHKDFFTFNIEVTNQGFSKTGEIFKNEEYDFEKYSKYYNTIILRSDSSQLRIPLDNFGGFLEIQNLYKSELDTIKINHYKLYSRCNIDTIKTWTTYIKKESRDIDKKKSNYKVIYKSLACKRKLPKTIKLIINGKIYERPIKTESIQNIHVTNGTGSNKSIFGKLKNRFYYQSIHIFYKNSMKIDILN